MGAQDTTIFRIDSVTTGAGTATNILSMRCELVMQIEPRFIPNTYQSPGVKQDHKWWEIILTFDSDTDIFDIYYTAIAANTAFNLQIDMTRTTPATERWTFENGKNYIVHKEFGRVEEGRDRQTFEYKVLCYGERDITTP